MLPGMASMACQRCGRQAPLKSTEFHRHIGMLVLMHHTTTRGFLCRDCITSVYSSHTAVTAVAGWWGMASFFITPFVLIYNTCRYLGALSLPRVHGRLGASAAAAPLPLPEAVALPEAVLATARTGSLPPPLPPEARAAEPIPQPVGDEELDPQACASAALAEGTLMGRYLVSRCGPERLTVVRSQALRRWLGWSALGCGCMAALGIASAASSGGMVVLSIFIIPAAGLLLAWYLTGWRCDLTGEVAIREGRTITQWPREDFYAVYVDIVPPGTSRLAMVLAERSPTTPFGGPVLAACESTGVEAKGLLAAAAEAATRLGLPLRATREARQQCTLLRGRSVRTVGV